MRYSRCRIARFLRLEEKKRDCNGFFFGALGPFAVTKRFIELVNRAHRVEERKKKKTPNKNEFIEKIKNRRRVPVNNVSCQNRPPRVSNTYINLISSK